MNLLLDTHVLLWFFYNDERLGEDRADLIEDPGNQVFVSSVSACEIANKVRIGKLVHTESFAREFAKVCTEHGFKPLLLNHDHATRAGLLPGAHCDPFDRLLAAQSMIEKMPIMTIDSRIRELGAEVVW